MTAAARTFATSYTPAVPRWWRFVDEHRLVCPVGHHIPRTAVINETGFLRCSKREGGTSRSPGGVECGRWVFLFAIAGGGCIVAEVALAEIDPMRELRTPAAVLRYLGIWTD